MLQNSRNVLTKRRINNNAFVVRHAKVMSTLDAIKLGGDVHKDRSVSIGGFSLNGHDSSHIMSE
jgi:hypothetical protein